MALPSAFHDPSLERLDWILGEHVTQSSASAVAWGLARHDEVRGGAKGDAERDTIFRIASMTKPVVAVAALGLVEECLVRLDDPVDKWLPEMADRRVLAKPEGPLTDTVPAVRPITLRDLLTFRSGMGFDFGMPGPQPVMEAGAELGLGTGPPAPAGPPEPDEFMRRLGTLPLARQPGERWLYHTSSDVLGVLVARVAGRDLATVLAERVFGPLGMIDTAFHVPASALDRFGPCYVTAPGRPVYDESDGQWAQPPAFPSGGGGLVSTVDDFLAFATMLRDGGTYRGERILSHSSVEAMTTNHLTPDQLAASSPAPDGSLGWGFGLSVQVARTGPTYSVGSYGWNGGLGSSWMNDPREDLIGVILTDQLFSSPALPPVHQDFWTSAYAALGD
ncbi:MAG TPA: serine hydrolase domain-containing protein [Acidimicrobiales bacterium]